MTRAPHLLLVEAPYYAHIAALLRDGAERAIAAAGATCEIVAVPGAFEIPPAIALAAKAGGRFDGFVGLGCVIRGETTHYDHICAETARSLQDLGVRGEHGGRCAAPERRRPAPQHRPAWRGAGALPAGAEPRAWHRGGNPRIRPRPPRPRDRWRCL